MASSLRLIVLLSAFLSGILATPTLRILGGSEANANGYPYVVSVRRNNAHICGGSIVASNYILTAAHCVSDIGTTPMNPSAITVRAGSTNQYAGGKIYLVKEIYINKSYGSFLNDVALIQLEMDLILGPKVQIIKMADTADAVTPGSSVVVAGWGSTEVSGPNAYKLHHGDAIVLSASDCENSIGYGHPSTICLQSKTGAGTCNGDAGGPAVYNNKVVGVSNFVVGTCGSRYPNVFARVSHFESWIDSIINPK